MLFYNCSLFEEKQLSVFHWTLTESDCGKQDVYATWAIHRGLGINCYTIRWSWSCSHHSNFKWKCSWAGLWNYKLLEQLACISTEITSVALLSIMASWGILQDGWPRKKEIELILKIVLLYMLASTWNDQKYPRMRHGNGHPNRQNLLNMPHFVQ